MKILVIDAQGGGVGRQLVAAVRQTAPGAHITAVGTNTAATSAMLRAGADDAATGENAVVVNCRTADVIIGPIGIMFANALLGEITPAIAAAIGASGAFKILIPVNRCNHYIAGCAEAPMSEYIRSAVEKLEAMLSGADT